MIRGPILPILRAPLAAAIGGGILFVITLIWGNGYKFCDPSFYLGLHVIMEFFSISVALAIFSVSWFSDSSNQFRSCHDANIRLLAFFLLAVAILDLSHTLSYPGMPTFIMPADVDREITLWIFARSVAALGFALASFFSDKKASLLLNQIIGRKKSVLAITLLIAGSIVFISYRYPDATPTMWLPEQGLTSTEKNLEYLISAIYSLTALEFLRQAWYTKASHLRYLAVALILSVWSELSFTLYTNSNDSFRLVGHLYKVVSYAFLFQAVFAVFVKHPYQSLLQARKELSASEERWRLALEGSNQVLWDWNLLTGEFFLSERWTEFTGFAHCEAPRTAVDWLDTFHPADRAACQAALDAHLQGKITYYEMEHRIRCTSGYRWVHCHGKALRDKTGKPVRLIGSKENIDQRKKIETAMCQNELKFRNVFDNASDAIFIFSYAGAFLDVNRMACQRLGYSRDEMLAMNIANIDDKNTLYPSNKLATLLSRQAHHYFETIHTCKNGATIPVEVSTRIIDFDAQKVILCTARDITDRKRVEEQLKHFSLHDSLTGLLNRAYFEQEMRRLEMSGTTPVGLILGDIDGLKLVNDTLGHHKGDALLLAAGEILRKCLRKDDIIARIGGDEFIILVTNCDRASIQDLCHRIEEAANEYNSHSNQLFLSISIGYAFRETSRNMNELFKEADDNMYRQKLHRKQSTRSTIVKTLMNALGERDFITEGHAERLRNIVAHIATALVLPETQINDLRLFAEFHDLGKVGIPDHILFKPGPLLPDEQDRMRQHCEIGYRIAVSAPDLTVIADWILKHHERWDGNGYPNKLQGNEIPLECRILAIADAYDAMVSDRPYRKAISQAEAVAEIRKCAGTQFDPALVQIFVEIEPSCRLDL